MNLLKPACQSSCDPKCSAAFADIGCDAGSAVTDLSPVAECPVEEITLTGLAIDNLEPLSLMPLRRLTLSAKDLSNDQLNVLSGLQQLEFLGEVGDSDDLTPDSFLKRIAASNCETS